MHLKRDVTLLRRYFKNNPGILLAYLFGSSARESVGWKKHKDLDVAVLLREEEVKKGILKPQTKIFSELTKLLKRTDIDVVILNDSPLLLRHEVIKNGDVLFEKCPEIRLDFETNSEVKYYDFEPYRNLFYNFLKKRIKEGITDAQKCGSQQSTRNC